jgi:hypothetical protein
MEKKQSKCHARGAASGATVSGTRAKNVANGWVDTVLCALTGHGPCISAPRANDTRKQQCHFIMQHAPPLQNDVQETLSDRQKPRRDN